MRLSPKQRREKLKIFNIAETAREIGVDYKRVYNDVWANRVVQPTTVFHKRAYFTLDELNKLKFHYTKGIKDERNKDS